MSLWSAIVRYKKHQPRTRQGARAHLRVESLEDRRVLSTFFVEPLSYPLDNTHVHTLQDALGAAANGDAIVIEPQLSIHSVGSTLGNLSGLSALAAAAASGDSTVTATQYVPPGEVLSIGGEPELVLSVAAAPGAQFSLALASPLASAHAAGTRIDTTGSLGVGKAVTIQGDTSTGLASIVSPLVIWQGTSGVTLLALQLENSVTLNAGSSGTSIRDNSFVGGGITEAPGTSLNGNNVISQNGFNGSTVNLAGNTSGTVTNDQVSFNRFENSTLALSHDDGTTIQGNTFVLANSTGSLTAISIPDSQNVTVTGNDISIEDPASASGATAVGVSVGTGTGSTPVAVSLLNNFISTSNIGIGVLITNPASNGNNLRVLLQGNDFRSDVIGVEDIGDGTNSLTAAGIVDAGGGVLGSLGANNFRSFNANDAANGVRFAIYLNNTVGTGASITALNNLYSGVTATSLIKDSANNTTAGSPPLAVGTGTINVGTPDEQLTPDQQFVQALYNEFLGRNGAVNELNGWVNMLPTVGQTGVANEIIHSTEGLSRLVDSYYTKYLNRPADPGGESFWVASLQHGMTAEQVIASFLSSGEYYDRLKVLYTDPDAAYVQSLYQNVLGRTGSQLEVNFWLGQSAAHGRQFVALGFTQSGEYRTAVVTELYFSLLHRTAPPSQAEVNGFVSSGVDILGIEAAIAGSGEFYING
jgi:hypothetical protein